MSAFVLRLIALVFAMGVLFTPFDQAHLARICMHLGVACGMFGLSFDTTRLRVDVRDWKVRRPTNVVTATLDVMGMICLATGIVVWCIVG
jgi:hypothetical protein